MELITYELQVGLDSIQLFESNIKEQLLSVINDNIKTIFIFILNPSYFYLQLNYFFIISLNRIIELSLIEEILIV